MAFGEAIILDMGKPVALPMKVFVRTNAKLRAEFKRLIGSVQTAEVFDRRTKALSQEVVQNAMWLWAREMDPEELAKALLPFIAKIEAMVSAEGSKAVVGLSTDVSPKPIAKGKRPG